MNAEQKVAKLESLLERINRNRTPAPVGLALSAAVAEAPAAAPPAASPQPPTPIPEAAPTPVPEAAPAAIIEPRIGSHRPTPATPMEMAVSGELEVREPSEPELEITYPDDDEPILTIEAEPTPVEPTRRPSAVEPPPEATPTAPVHTRSPEAVEPRRIQTSATHPSAPIARVVSRPEPRTFGELLDLALALRPR